MLKITSLAIGLLTVMVIAPNAQALNVNVNNQATQPSNKNLQAQITVILGGQPTYHGNTEYRGSNQYEYHRQRAAELRRIKLERLRLEEKRRYEYRSHRNRSNYGRYHQQVNNGYGGYYNNDNHGTYNNSKEYTDYR
jgi:hypothetical protein